MEVNKFIRFHKVNIKLVSKCDQRTKLGNIVYTSGGMRFTAGSTEKNNSKIINRCNAKLEASALNHENHITF